MTDRDRAVYDDLRVGVGPLCCFDRVSEKRALKRSHQHGGIRHAVESYSEPLLQCIVERGVLRGGGCRTGTGLRQGVLCSCNRMGALQVS